MLIVLLIVFVEYYIIKFISMLFALNEKNKCEVIHIWNIV